MSCYIRLIVSYVYSSILNFKFTLLSRGKGVVMETIVDFIPGRQSALCNLASCKNNINKHVRVYEEPLKTKGM